MTGLHSSERGWHMPSHAKYERAHYFVNRRSLCEDFIAPKGTTYFDSACVLEREDCAICVEILLREKPAAPEPAHPRDNDGSDGGPHEPLADGGADVVAVAEGVPTPRWKPLRYHAEQQRLWRSTARFNVAEAGRRSGKSEFGKRIGVRETMRSRIEDWFAVFAAPTRDQAKAIFWDDLQALVPPQLIAEISRSELFIRLLWGPVMQVAGLDKPHRVEGRPIDFVVLDEVWAMRRGVWARNLRPALSTDGRPGRGVLCSVPRPSAQLKELVDQAQSDDPDYAYFHWTSEEILPPEEIEAAKRDLDPLTYEQEYQAKRVNFAGRAYYAFERAVHAAERIAYDPKLPLRICFDFNVEPGVAVVCQEIQHAVHEQVTAVIGEVWIPIASNTPAVCRRLIADWGKHEGAVLVYGDATGGARHTSQLEQSQTDWGLIRQILGAHFRDRFAVRVGQRNPAERARVNAVNARLRSADGKVHLVVDPVKAPHVVDDFESVLVKPGTDGELLKEPGSPHTHLSDGLGYMLEREHPLTSRQTTAQPIY